MKKVQEWTRDQGTLGFQALHDDRDTHALRHSEQSLSVGAQVIKAKVRGERRGEGREESGRGHVNCEQQQPTIVLGRPYLHDQAEVAGCSLVL